MGDDVEAGSARRRLRHTLGWVGDLLHGGPVDLPQLRDLEAKLYFDLDGSRDPYVRFAVLLVLSVVIATGGILADSTATVIGAMIVAPLMTPILASALAMVTGDQRHLARSLVIVGAGVGVAIGLSLVMGWLAIGTPDPHANSQIAGRTSPRSIDLVVALASGAAGAFAVSRRSVADALPGVAIAISLVPPLCVVGISLAVADVGAAAGASLLFATNFLAILVAGGGLFAIMGFGAVSRRDADDQGRRRAAIVTGVALVVVVIPLLATTMRVAQDSLLEARARSATSRWLEGSGYGPLLIVADGDRLTISIDGSGPLPPTESLLEELLRTDPDLRVVLRVLAAEHLDLTQAVK